MKLNKQKSGPKIRFPEGLEITPFNSIFFGVLYIVIYVYIIDEKGQCQFILMYILVSIWIILLLETPEVLNFTIVTYTNSHSRQEFFLLVKDVFWGTVLLSFFKHMIEAYSEAAAEGLKIWAVIEFLLWGIKNYLQFCPKFNRIQRNHCFFL